MLIWLYLLEYQKSDNKASAQQALSKQSLFMQINGGEDGGAWASETTNRYHSATARKQHINSEWRQKFCGRARLSSSSTDDALGGYKREKSAESHKMSLFCYLCRGCRGCDKASRELILAKQESGATS